MLGWVAVVNVQPVEVLIILSSNRDASKCLEDQKPGMEKTMKRQSSDNMRVDVCLCMHACMYWCPQNGAVSYPSSHNPGKHHSEAFFRWSPREAFLHVGLVQRQGAAIDQHVVDQVQVLNHRLNLRSIEREGDMGRSRER